MASTTSSPEATIQQLKEKLNLQPHPEGGFYAETYRGDLSISTPVGERSSSTGIYFLITPEAVTPR